MSSSALRIMAILLAIGAAVLGYIGYQASQEKLPTETQLTQPSNVEPLSYPIVVATKDIAAEQEVKADDIKVTMVNKQINEGFTEQQPLIGLTSRMAISSGDMLLPAHFHSLSAVSANLHPGERAVAVKVDEVTGVGGYIEPGDKVDVLLFLPAGQETDNQSSAQLLLPAIRVVAYGNQLDELDQQQIRQKSRAYLSASETNTISKLLTENNATENDKKPTVNQSKTAVLAVDQAEVSTLLLAESTGRIRLALVGEEALKGESTLSEPKNHFISLDALKGQQINTNISPEKELPSPVKATPQKIPAKVTVHRGLQETVVNVDQEK